ncbi:MAG: hypothetical protein AAB583_04595, partial [Patescibacteria group bacterium]
MLLTIVQIQILLVRAKWVHLYLAQEIKPSAFNIQYPIPKPRITARLVIILKQAITPRPLTIPNPPTTPKPRITARLVIILKQAIT